MIAKWAAGGSTAKTPPPVLAAIRARFSPASPRERFVADRWRLRNSGALDRNYALGFVIAAPRVTLVRSENSPASRGTVGHSAQDVPRL